MEQPMNNELNKFIEDIKKEGVYKDLHITRMCSSLVAISNGKVIKLTEPKLKYCPLAESFYHIKSDMDLNSLKVKIVEAVEWKISQLGSFTDFRQLYRKSIAVPYGASEMMMYDLKKGRNDAAVIVCDGAGTVITDDPNLVQGIGARMNGVFYTSPIKKVMDGIEEHGGTTLSPETAKIDQVAGVEWALNRYKKIAVTVSGYGEDSLKSIIKLEEKYSASVTILVVCTTGIGENRVREIGKYGDLIWSCASGRIRKIVGEKAKLQIASKIPVYALTQKALDFVSSYSSNGLGEYLDEHKGPFIISSRCKEFADVYDCKKIGMGDFEAYIGTAKKLPIRDDKEPWPLL
jgi:putative methanogenesis marker protein 8